jgi:Tol biopolymer transport system component
MRGFLRVVLCGFTSVVVAACGGGSSSPPRANSPPSSPTFGTAAFGTPEAVHPAGKGRDMVFSADGRFIGLNRVVNGISQAVVIDIAVGTEEIASVSDSGVASDAASSIADISADGRYVLFNSMAWLVPDVTYPTENGSRPTQAFIRDRLLQRTEVISIGFDGLTAASLGAGGGDNAISKDGRYVVFTAKGANLAAGIQYFARNASPANNVYVRDRVARNTEIVSVTPDGSTSGGFTNLAPWQYYSDSNLPVISADGRFVAFTSMANNLVAGAIYSGANTANVFVRDRLTSTTQLASAGPDGRTASSGSCWIKQYSGQRSYMSEDGSKVVFNCEGGFLAVMPSAKDPERDHVADVYLWDATTKSNVLVSRSFDGREGGDADAHTASVSADGRFVTFLSPALNLVDGFTFYGAFGVPFTNVYRYDSMTGAVMLISESRIAPKTASDANIERVDMAADGQTVSFLADAEVLAPIPLSPFYGNVYVWRAVSNELKAVSLQSAAENWGELGPYAVLRQDGKGLVYARYGLVVFEERIFYVELN